MKKKRKLNAKGRRKRKKRILKRIFRLMILLIPILIICFFISIIRNKDSEDTSSQKDTQDIAIETSSDVDTLITGTILSGGDVIMHEPFLRSSYYLSAENTYDYSSIFTFVKDIYNSSDYTLLNFESTISENDYCSYPLFRAPSAIATALSQNGVDMCLLANNHIYDNSDAGLVMTQNAMKDNSLAYAGVYTEAPTDHFQVIDVNGIKVGIMNYTYETAMNDNGNHTINAIPVHNEALKLIDTFNYGELDLFYSEIQESLISMDNINVDFTIAYIHWGDEYDIAGTAKQTEIAQKLCDLGVDALIGGHPHVIQPVDLLQSSSNEHQMLCVYSMGNHLSNQYKGRIQSAPEGHTEDGLMVELSLSKDEQGQVTLNNVTFIPTWTYRTVGVDDLANPEYFVFPLNDVENVISKAREHSGLDISEYVQQSLARTNAIIGTGTEKVKAALPLTY